MTRKHYPLDWPETWPRTPADNRTDGRSIFRRSNGITQSWAFVDARDALLNEFRLSKAEQIVISSNFRSDRLGRPVEGNRRPKDQGIAVYFTISGQTHEIAHDAYLRFEENCRAVTLVLSAMRTIGRYGGGAAHARAMSGFVSLPPPRRWWDILGVSPEARASEIEQAFKRKARQAHPDAGGTTAEMAELNAARDQGLKDVAA